MGTGLLTANSTGVGRRVNKVRQSVGLVSAILVASVIALSDRALAQGVRWKLHSAYSEGVPIVGAPPHRIAETVEKMSGGEFRIRVFDPGAIVSGTKYYDAVSKGALQAAYGVSGFHAGKNSAFAFFSSVPFGPGAAEYLAWLKYGGGIELARELYSRANIHYILCGMVPPESAGWFRDEITSIDELRGLKMRFFGLGAMVMEKFGVSTQLLAGGDIYPALELGVIDATEFSVPAIDRAQGFYQIAKHNYFPGWHQQSTAIELIVNKKAWEQLSADKKAMINTACAANVTEMIAEGEALQYEAMLANREDGTIIHRWPDTVISQFEEAWQEVIAKETQSNDDSARIWASFSEFRGRYKIWRDNGYLK